MWVGVSYVMFMAVRFLGTMWNLPYSGRRRRSSLGFAIATVYVYVFVATGKGGIEEECRRKAPQREQQAGSFCRKEACRIEAVYGLLVPLTRSPTPPPHQMTSMCLSTFDNPLLE